MLTVKGEVADLDPPPLVCACLCCRAFRRSPSPIRSRLHSSVPSPHSHSNAATASSASSPSSRYALPHSTPPRAHARECSCLTSPLLLSLCTQTMSRLLVFEPKNYSEIASVLRQLVRKAETRLAAWPHFKTAMRLLEGYGPDNAPFGTDELQVRVLTVALSTTLHAHGI